MFLLRSGLAAHQGILDHLLRVDFAPQSVFLDVGRALQHELFVSRYFCPPAALEFRGEYDRVSSVRLLEALRQTYEDKKRRAFALALLGAFRSLRSLRYVPAPPTPHTRRVLIILALVRSELQALVGYLESDLARMIATVEGVGAAAAAGRAAAVPIRAALERLPPILADPLTDRAQIDGRVDLYVCSGGPPKGSWMDNTSAGSTSNALWRNRGDWINRCNGCDWSNWTDRRNGRHRCNRTDRC